MKEGNNTDTSRVQTEKTGKSSVGGKDRLFAFRSIRFQTFVYFFLLAAFVLIVLWLFQFIFFKAAYRSMEKTEIESLGDKIISKYPGGTGNKEFDNYLNQTAYNNGLFIIIFRLASERDGMPEAGCFSVEYAKSQFYTEGDVLASADEDIISNWESFYPKVKEKKRVSYLTSTERGNYVVFGAKLDNAGGYLYMTASVLPLNKTTSVMTDQLLFATIICLLLSTVVAIFISNRVTKPIAEFSRAARKLGEGDYSVRFKGNGYIEIENLAETLNYTAEEFGKTEQLRRDFLANVGHDLRTPLTMVKAYAEMIRDISGNDEAKRTRHSQVIVDEADRLTALVGDILNLSKLQSGTETLSLAPVDIRGLVKIVIERFDVYSARDGYVFDFASEGNCMAIGDYKRLEQVLYNLVGNAINYTGDNKTVLIRVADSGDKVRVSVRDYGSGIAPEELDSVWERYYRTNQSRRNVVGSGLGLSIVKNILMAHNSLYGVNSTLGEGTEFWFELESVDKPAPALPPADNSKKSRGGESKKSKKQKAQ